nr:hypothetical protein [Tanacetum cinerariifolium]
METSEHLKIHHTRGHHQNEGRKETILVNLQESVNEAFMTVKAHSVNHQVGIGKRVEVMIRILKERRNATMIETDAETKTGTSGEDELSWNS